jgi:D-alanyl-D-alanine carboxypeptidase (penicillin-binding protein 5/6)
LQAPIKQGQVLGKMQLVKDGRPVQELELVSSVEIRRASWWTSVKQVLGEVLHLPEQLQETE